MLKAVLAFGPSYGLLFWGASPADPRWLASLVPSYVSSVLHLVVLRSYDHNWFERGTEDPGPNDPLVRHRASWGILPQTPVFSLRSARRHM
jgi:hypothetical protein